MDFGKWLRQKRTEQGIVLKKLVKLSGISLGAISRIETGANRPTVFSALLLCEGLGESLNDLIAETTTIQMDGRISVQQDNQSDMLTTGDVSTFVHFVEEHPKQGRERFVDLLENGFRRVSDAINGASQADSHTSRIYLEPLLTIRFGSGDVGLPFSIKFDIEYPSPVPFQVIRETVYRGGAFIRTDLAEYVKHLRHKKQMPLQELAEGLQSSNSVLSRIETGALTWIKLEDLLKLDEFFEDRGRIATIGWNIYMLEKELGLDASRFIKEEDQIIFEWRTQLAGVLITLFRALQTFEADYATWVKHLRRAAMPEGAPQAQKMEAH